MKKNKLLTTSVLLALLALVSVTAATAAWMSIADRTRVSTMRMEITSGANLRFDLDPHPTFEEYRKTLSFVDIAARIARDQDFDPLNTPLTPVTTGDLNHFVLENGAAAKKSDYLEFTLHFMATRDMVVHLTSAGDGGTRVHSNRNGVPQALRISFSAEESGIYDPGLGDSSEYRDAGRHFGLPDGGSITYNDNNTLFRIQKDVDKPVVVRVWLEGTDPACVDAIRNADFQIWLRFIGTDEDGNLLDDGSASRQR